MYEEEYEEITIDKEAATKALNKQKSLQRLYKNRDFKAVVLEGFLSDEAVQLVLAKGDMSTQSPEIQAKITKDIDAIGSFQQYLNRVNQFGNQALKAVEDYENALAAAEEQGE